MCTTLCVVPKKPSLYVTDDDVKRLTEVEGSVRLQTTVALSRYCAAAHDVLPVKPPAALSVTPPTVMALGWPGSEYLGGFGRVS